MMNEHPINNMMNTAMDNLKQMVDVNTIVGNPVMTENGVVVIPVSKVSFGMAAGGSEFSAKDQRTSNPFAGGVGAGVSISPVAFLVVNEEDVKLLPVAEGDAVSKLIDFVPTMVNKISDLLPKKKNDGSNQE